MQHVRELIDDVLEKLDGIATTRTVVGEPMEVKGRTVIPFVEVSIGCGGGGGEGNGEGAGTDDRGREGKGRGEGRGAGVGGGVQVSPVAVVCVEESGVTAFGLNAKKGFLGKIAEMMPQIIEKCGREKGSGEGTRRPPSGESRG